MDSDKQCGEPFTDKRDKIIVRTSVIGIATNVLLAAFKAAVGLASHSIAVVLDAVNNLSTHFRPSSRSWARNCRGNILTENILWDMGASSISAR